MCVPASTDCHLNTERFQTIPFFASELSDIYIRQDGANELF